MASSSNGYLLNVLVYTGAQTLDGSTADELPQPARVVMHLMEPYISRGHHVFADRYYSSIPLVKALEQKGTAFTGVCNKNRVGLPRAIRQPLSLHDNEIVCYRAGIMLCLAWRAEKKKNPVVMLSSDASSAVVTISARHQNGRNVKKPKVVDLYNHNMNGVDISDQLSVSYPFPRKTRKW